MINLDKQQAEAVHTESHRALVLAGAGSGKTRVLIERIAYLVEEKKVSPYEIMAFTFTRKAAGEIKSRLEERIGPQVHRCTMGTMHALALSMINRFGEIIGLKSKKVTVYSQWEEDFLLKDVAQEMGLHDGKKWKKIKKGDVDDIFNAYYQRGIEPKEDDALFPLFRAFIQRCRENNSLTYGGLLIGLRMLIPTLKQYLHIKHILVDEVQDIDRLQWAIILEMEEVFGAHVFLVGDIDQSIYEWRGAAPKYLVDHQSEFEIYRLEMNYRSKPEIVFAANNLINHNQDRIAKTMKPAREWTGDIVSVMQDTDSERIVHMHPFFTCPVAILARTHSLLSKIDRIMEEAAIPHLYIGKNAALTNSEPFRRFHAFLKLLVNPFDNFAFLLIKDLLGIKREEFSQTRIKAAQQGKSHFQVWDYQNKNYDYYECITCVEEEKFYTLQYASNRLNDDFPDLCPEAHSFIEGWNAKNNGSIAGYLEWLATYDLQDEIKEEQRGITLMTIHAAKGLEWPVVIVSGCNEGIMPSKQALGHGELEADRRLAYVAWTRAKDQLVLTVRPEVGVYGDINPPSRFIGESGL